MQAIGASASFDETLKSDFKDITTKLAALLVKEGLKTRAYIENLPYFSKLSSEEMRATVQDLKLYYDLCAHHVIEGQSLRDSKKLTWRAMSKMGMSPPSDFLNHITEGDIVEIYGTNHVQLFRNLEFFELCSYSLEELFCNEWYLLFHRDDAITAQMMAATEALYNKRPAEVLISPFPEHLVYERMSEDKHYHYVDMKVVAPLYHQKQISGLIAISTATKTTAPENLA